VFVKNRVIPTFCPAGRLHFNPGRGLYYACMLQLQIGDIFLPRKTTCDENCVFNVLRQYNSRFS